MLPYEVDRLAEERRGDLLRLSQANVGVRLARRAHRRGSDVHGWRRRAGRALVNLAVTVGVSRPRRGAVRRSALDLLNPCR